MRTLIGSVAAAAILAAAPAAFAQPTPREQVGMFIGDTHTNGSAVIVHDENGIHPQGYEGHPPINQLAADNHTLRAPYRHHRHHRSAAQTQY